MPPEQEQPINVSDARIPARSRRLAMDWSLVLTSQGIPTIIENHPETGWALVVTSIDHGRALESIRQYRFENARWPWRKPVLRAPLIFDWASIMWVMMIGIFHYASSVRPVMQNAGLMDTTLVASGQWWRLFTAIWLHADYAHLAGNAAIGFMLLGLSMGLHGTGLGLLAAYLAGVGGNLTDWMVYGDGHHSLGASGMVMGALGLLAVQSFILRRELNYAKKYIFGGIASGVMLFTLLALSPESDVVAHLGGFISGIFFGVVLSFFSKSAHNIYANAVAAVIFAIFIVTPWYLAFTSLPTMN